ncbi:hypothetical protein P20652_3815 [Pseudoalteromonas sp. BSi20652]|nr:hypothetical protein P20652_3815 [Pseudoalteromonas sp. BSi20652]
MLADDIGNQHIVYQPDDSRAPDDKKQMCEGMSFFRYTHVV